MNTMSADDVAKIAALGAKQGVARREGATRAWALGVTRELTRDRYIAPFHSQY